MKIKNGIESPKKFNVEELLEFLASELNIKDDVELMVVYNNALLEKLSTKDIEYEALLQNTFPDKYVLYVKENVSGLQYVLCHELVHLSQYDRGDLKMSFDFKTVTGKGIEHSNTYPYETREGEEEAFKMQNKLGKKFKKK